MDFRSNDLVIWTRAPIFLLAQKGAYVLVTGQNISDSTGCLWQPNSATHAALGKRAYTISLSGPPVAGSRIWTEGPRCYPHSVLDIPTPPCDSSKPMSKSRVPDNAITVHTYHRCSITKHIMPTDCDRTPWPIP